VAKDIEKEVFVNDDYRLAEVCEAGWRFSDAVPGVESLPRQRFIVVDLE
jgi:hypothetical protein